MPLNEYKEPIDVAFQTASQEELFRTQMPAPDQSEEALRELANEVQQDPARCFCRNCGKPVYKAASVCVNCNYVINPAALQQAQQIVRARRQKYEKGHKIFSTINMYTGIDLEPPERKALFQIRPQHYEYLTTGAVYCTNCGAEVDEGASQCIHCQYILNPAAYKQAQLAIADRSAKLTKSDIIKALLLPGWGIKTAKKFALRRPQIAKPCRWLGLANIAIWTAVIIGLSFL